MSGFGILAIVAGGALLLVVAVNIIGRRLSQKPIAPGDVAGPVRYALEYFSDEAVLFLSLRRGTPEWPFVQLQVRESGERRRLWVGIPRLEHDSGDFDRMTQYLDATGAPRIHQAGSGRVLEFVEYELPSDPEEVSATIEGLIMAVPRLATGPLYAFRKGHVLYEKRLRDIKAGRAVTPMDL